MRTKFSKKADMLGARWLRDRFGLTHAEAERLALHPEQGDILQRVDAWREANGLPASNSPLVRGMVLDAIKGTGTLITDNGRAYQAAEQTEPLEIGARVQTPHGPGAVAYRRMRAPDWAKVDVYSVRLDARAGDPSYTSTTVRAEDCAREKS